MVNLKKSKLKLAPKHKQWPLHFRPPRMEMHLKQQQAQPPKLATKLKYTQEFPLSFL